MSGFVLKAGDLNRRIRFERPAKAGGLKSAGKSTWEPVATVWAQVRDLLPSRGEQNADGATNTRRPARVRIRYRTDITSTMRILLGRTVKDAEGNPVWQTERVMEIVSAPAELGNRVALELMVEDYSTAGGA